MSLVKTTINVTPRVNKLINSLGKQQLDFWLARDQVMQFETAANLCASQYQPTIFFQFSLFLVQE